MTDRELLKQYAPELRFTRAPATFSVGLKFQSDLEQGVLSEGFRQAFKDHGVSLSENKNITIEEEVEGSRWRIDDANQDHTYIIIVEDEMLNIYKSYDAEAFFPTDVDAFVNGCSLHIAYRLLGLIRLHQMEVQALSRAADLAFIPPGPRFLEWLARSPFVSKVVSLRFAQLPHKRKEPRDKWNWEAGCGCGCLSLIPALALIALALASLLSWQQVALLVAGLVLLAATVVLPDKWQWGRLIVFAMVSVPAYLALGRGHWLGNLCFGLWFVSGLLTAAFGAATQWGGILRSLMDALSALDDRTGKAIKEKLDSETPAPPIKVYGRVVRPRGASHWQCALQYWFFYPMNDWRTRHDGLNDHEGDWEQVTVFLPVDPLADTMVGYSQHFTKVVRPLYERRPVVYVAAGSHANYPAKGEHPLGRMILTVLRHYPNQVLPRLGSTARATGLAVGVQAGIRSEKTMKRFASLLKRSLNEDEAKDILARFERPSLQEIGKGDRPIVDRALGDHDTHIGPGYSNWSPETLELIGEATPWVQYKGHWGRWVLWPGERGPGGPMYSGGHVRPEWRDPFRWAGLPA